MGFLNKVKNIFFEEEVVEIEENEKKVKKEAPVAKKIELPKVEKVENHEVEEVENEVIDLEEKKEPTKEAKFPMVFDDDDFKEEPVQEETYDEPVVPRRSERHTVVEEEVVEEEPVYEEEIIQQEEPKYDFEMEYGREKEPESHGPYEGKNARKAFTPTPIISPIYGILDKNYKKDDVVTKKEIRLSSAPKKIDLDYVREKAYGDLTTDITQSMEDVNNDYEKDNFVDMVEEEDLLYDLNDDDTSPVVKEVTVGDAEEYFNELGLEYNIDYKDTSVENSKTPKEKTRRSEPEEEPIVEDTIDIEEDESKEEGLESNLFDLIETMYEEKE